MSQNSFQESLLLPKTDFPMKADLLVTEREIQKRWEENKVYDQALRQKDRVKTYILHDGPPYANGSIHMGHLLNKVLKDIVVRTRLMSGYRTDFIPGWDCHGLPIEHRVQEDMKKGGEKTDIRKKCEEYAAHYKEIQASEMKKLGTLGDYEFPYYTMSKEYESATLELFADLVERGLVYRGLKPVHWSIENQTALAEAELEYKEREDPSIYVLFPVVSKNLHLLVWTTTPWTLAANLAISVAPEGKYGVYEVKRESKTFQIVLAVDLHQRVFEQASISEYKLLNEVLGKDLAGLEYQHPFIERKGKIYSADFVTLEDGTGLVHCAPGHGVDDYQMGLKEGFPVYCPVKGNGTYDETVPEWLRGVHVWKANKIVCEKLLALNLLFHQQMIKHSYPHDWRSKTPTIFRATDQWFIGVDRQIGKNKDTLRSLALHAIDHEIYFIPDFGKNRLRGMIENRPDWCISRQRSWGLPIPAFFTEKGEVLLTPQSIRTVAKKFKEKGSNVWFQQGPAELLSEYDSIHDPLAPKDLQKEKLKAGNDTFDVWFESGSSWYSVLVQRGLAVPADLYLEGSDQHRGWFQVSLLTALGKMGKPPFKTLLTHGFMVDVEGKKMSKSAGNAVTVEQLLSKYGADIARWWVSSVQFVNDIKLDWSHFKIAAEEYRKIRNTIRFLLGNLSDFDPNKDAYSLSDRDQTSIDVWALSEISKSFQMILKYYEQYEFQRAHDEIFKLCNEILSATYFMTVKDRLYCDPADSPRRRRTQTVFFETASSLIRLISPILVHTADEAWMYFHKKNSNPVSVCVHLERFPIVKLTEALRDWDQVFKLRTEVLRTVEQEKGSLGITNPLDCGVEIELPKSLFASIEKFQSEIADLCNISQFKIKGGAELKIKLLDLRSEFRCERSWKRDGTVKKRGNGALLSDRDALVLGLS